MRNNSSSRVLFVPTVDGLSIMSGKEASFSSRGYIVNAYDALTIDGWRTSNDKVAEFYFSSPKESYAVKKSKGGNLGVIGCAVFKEKVKEKIVFREYIPVPTIPVNPWPVYPPVGPFWQTMTSGSSTSGIETKYTMQSAGLNTANTACNYSVQTSSASAGLGTGFGQDKYSPVVSVNFDKETSPEATFSIFYNTRQRLEDMGIEFRKPIYVTPSAFPNEDGYCERP